MFDDDDDDDDERLAIGADFDLPPQTWRAWGRPALVNDTFSPHVAQFERVSLRASALAFA
jgi:hypothetical protein